jgi:hypothetical protein
LTDRGWKRPFDNPVPLPGGGQLVTLEDAGSYITRLPQSEHTAPEWQAAQAGFSSVTRQLAASPGSFPI